MARRISCKAQDTAQFTRRDWAWEFLRRNCAFRDELAAFQARHTVLRGVKTISCEKGLARKWGCLFAEAAAMAAPDAAVFWQSGVAPGILHLAAFERRIGFKSSLIDISKLPCRVSVLNLPGGHQHLLIQDGARALQLVISGSDVLKPVHLFPEPVQPDMDAAHFTEAALDLRFLIETGHLPERAVPETGRPPRLDTVLRALDGALAGLPHRDIAIALFGEKRVQADWNDPGRHLQDHVRRAIRRGRDLMDGGYRALLAAG